MRPITIIAIFEVFILVAILILTPIFASIGANQPLSGAQILTPVPPILVTNTTSAEAMLSFAQTVQQITTTPLPGISFLAEVEQIIFDLTNEERRKQRLKALQPDPKLQTAARAHSSDMLERYFFAHASPEGRTPFDRIAIIHRQLVGGTGENIWQGKGHDVNDAQKLADLVVEGWMNSPGHRENILRDTYSHLGVGGAVKGDRVKFTQNFASTQALFQQPLPLKVKSGDNLSLATIPILQKSAPVKYGFWSSEKGMLAAKPVSIKQTPVAVAPGDYRLRLYFVTSRKRSHVNYIIYNGPQVVVEP